MDTRQIAKKALNSVVIVNAIDSIGNVIRQGSGFFISNDMVVTNHHVLSGCCDLKARLVGGEEDIYVYGYLALSVENDLVVLKTEELSAKGLVLADGGTLSIGESVFAIGNPKGAEGTFSNGIVSAMRSAEIPSKIQFTAPISSGSSGGPLLNGNGEVVGVVTEQILDAQNLNFAIDVKRLDALVQDISNQKTINNLSSLPPRLSEDKRNSHGSSAREMALTYRFGGVDVSVDIEKAIRWYVISANEGCVDSQVELGSMYYTGDEITQDYQEAIKWYSLAAKNNHAQALYQLGAMHHLGEGTLQDFGSAHALYMRAASQGNLHAQHGLGVLYEQGLGVAADPLIAVEWYLQAAFQGESNAQCSLGTIYYMGETMPQDFPKAFMWFSKAAEQGKAFAQYMLGAMYRNGQGAATDIVSSHAWLTLALIGGFTQAGKVLETLQLTPNQRSQAGLFVHNWLTTHKHKS